MKAARTSCSRWPGASVWAAASTEPGSLAPRPRAVRRAPRSTSTSSSPTTTATPSEFRASKPSRRSACEASCGDGQGRRPDGPGPAANFKLEIYTRPSTGTWPISARTTTSSGSGSRRPTIDRSTGATTTSSNPVALAVTFQPDWIIEAMGSSRSRPKRRPIRVQPTADPNARRPASFRRPRAMARLTANDDRLEQHPAHQRAPHLRGQDHGNRFWPRRSSPSYKDYDLEKTESAPSRAATFPKA